MIEPQRSSTRRVGGGLVLAVVTALALLSGCEATQRVSVGSTEVPLPVVPSVAQTRQCGVDRSTIETAIEAYTLLKSEPPASGEDLVTEGFLKEFPSDAFSIDASSGDAVLTGIGPCAGK